MALCENCKNKSCGYASEDVIRCGDFEENLVQTNADRIRAMSDEELAEWITCPQYFGFKMVCDTSCDACCLEWLKQPAKEDAE